MKAKDVMTSPVVSIEQDASIFQAVRIMLQRHISGLPVIDHFCGGQRPERSAGGRAGSSTSSGRAG